MRPYTLPPQEMAARLGEALAKREWFVTGDIDPVLFSDSFVFKDDNVATVGVRSYALGVRKLFDQETARVEVIGVETDESKRCVVVHWRLEGRVNLPFRLVVVMGG
ncbi:hypothetical protein FOA52_010765 [Chlamydomonas sp. UWO 241]|nr:hypothetical protein FOA52_010765 [Chlamydomonas sp. UWO 241]